MHTAVTDALFHLVVPTRAGDVFAGQVNNGIDPVDDSRSVWFGPLLVTRTESGFTRIAAIGGYAGVAL